jgi:hypothetical protein
VAGTASPTNSADLEKSTDSWPLASFATRADLGPARFASGWTRVIEKRRLDRIVFDLVEQMEDAATR